MELYNKYRPEKFTEVIGQPYATGIGQSIASGDDQPGMILSGPKGTGKSSLARIIGAALNCDFVDEETGDPCGECESCRDIFARRGTDVIEHNAADNSSIHDAREIIKSVSVGIPRKKKVLIIDEAQRLSQEAKSAFLNVTEYPIENVVIIMTTTELRSIPPANRSRMSIGDLKPLSDSDIKEVLDRAISGEAGSDARWEDITGEDIESIVAVSEGSAREALSRLSDRVYRGIKFTAGSGATTEIADAIVDGRFGDVIRKVGDAIDDGVEAVSLVDNIASVFAQRASDGDEDVVVLLREVMEVRSAVASSSLAGRVAQAGLGAVAAPASSSSSDSGYTKALEKRLIKLEKKIDSLLDMAPEWPDAGTSKENESEEPQDALESRYGHPEQEESVLDEPEAEEQSNEPNEVPAEETTDRENEPEEEGELEQSNDIFHIDDELSARENAQNMVNFIKESGRFKRVVKGMQSKKVKIKAGKSGPKIHIPQSARIPKGEVILLGNALPGRVVED